MKLSFLLTALFVLWSAPLSSAAELQTPSETRLAVNGSHFTLNGKQTFLYGISYYAALGASEDFVRADLADMQRCRLNWIRVWATWAGFSNNVSAVDAEGRARPPFL